MSLKALLVLRALFCTDSPLVSSVKFACRIDVNEANDSPAKAAASLSPSIRSLADSRTSFIFPASCPALLKRS